MTNKSVSKEGWQTEETYYYQIKPDQTPSEAVIRAVASASGRKPTPLSNTEGGETLDPLYNVINPDALDKLCNSTTENSQSAGTVKFRYSGYAVTVDGTELVTVTES